MARAAVVPSSPAKRGARTVPRAAMKTTAASAARAKASADARKKTATKAAPTNYDSDDTDDELDVLTKQPEKPRARAKPAPRPSTKTTTSTSTTTARGRKDAQAAAPVKEIQVESQDEQATKLEPKKRAGRPKKTSPPTETPAVTAPKTRGRPKGSTNKTAQASTTKKTTTTRKNTRTVPESEPASDSSEPKHIVIATNSTTMRSNILRGPAKKKTVTFQDVMGAESGSEEELAVPAPTSKKETAKATGRSGLGGTPVRKAGATRGRQPVAKKDAAQPLSPKKAKQMTKSLSAYASSDGEEDELAGAKEDIKSPVRLVVHSPVKDVAENPSLASPVRRINFTPKKASNMVDENGEPKTSSPKHGSTGLSSPVRKINFTPKRSQAAQGDDDYLTLTPGKNIDFNDSMFMSSPARRPEFSPFKFSHADAPNHHLSQSVSAPNFTPAQASPLKLSPRKGQLGASFIRPPEKASTPAFPARTSLFQSPAKKGVSPFKSSLLAYKSSATDQAPQDASISTTPTSLPNESPMALGMVASQEDEDIELVEDVARDIFGIELESYQRLSHSPSPKISMDIEIAPSMEVEGHQEPDDESVPITNATEVCDVDPIEVEEDQQVEKSESEHVSDRDIDEQIENLQKEIQDEPEDFGTICFNTMESLQAPFNDFEKQDVFEDEIMLDDVSVQEVDHEMDQRTETREEAEDMGTICFNTLESLQSTPKGFDKQDALDDEDVQQDAHSVDEELLSEADVQNENPLQSEADEDADEDFAGPVMQPSSESKAEPLNTEYLDISPSDHTLNFDTLERLQETIESGSDQEEHENDENEESLYHVQESDEEQDLEEMENDQPTLVPAETTVTIMSNAGLPEEVNGSELRTHPFERMPSIPPPAPTPPADQVTPSVQESSKSNNRLYDINLEPRLDADDSIFETTLSEIPTPRAPSAADTPSAAGRRKSNFNVNLGFTPLAQQFTNWETESPSHNRSGRPRRRGVFSLVGPLEKVAEPNTTATSDVSYPDLSRTPLMNTPSLFAELPLQGRSDGGSMSPVSVATAKSPAATECSEVMNYPSESEIFEDTDHTALEAEHEEIRSRQVSSTPEPIEQQDQAMLSDEEKENSDTPVIPATPIRAFPEPRTIHTISKVPLKGEGEVSPLKIPRKRGHSLSGASPTRSSPRARKPAFRPFVDSAPTLSPTRKSARVDRSPSPKRRCSAPRRSMEAPKSPAVVRSPSKSPRKAKPASNALQGAVVHVDVHTTEGEDASGIFVELLQQMGARCVMSWSWNGRSSLSPVDGVEPKDGRVGITHVVYKDGGLRTLEKVKQASGLVKCVGVGWVLDCERENKWLDEAPYCVDSSIVPRGGAKRRKSMEPRALSNVNGTIVQVAEPSTPSASGRRCGADRGAIDGFRKITPPSPQKDVPSTPTHQSSDQYNFPQTPGYNFANLDAIGMSPATPYFLSNRNQLVQQSCPPKQSNKGLFPVSRPTFSLEQESEEDARKQQRARMEAARRKSLFYRPAAGSPLKK